MTIPALLAAQWPTLPSAIPFRTTQVGTILTETNAQRREQRARALETWARSHRHQLDARASDELALFVATDPASAHGKHLRDRWQAEYVRLLRQGGAVHAHGHT